MLRKAHEIQSEISNPEIRDKIRKVKLAKEFEQCSLCGGQLEHHHQIEANRDTLAEWARCQHCDGRSPVRRYKIM